MPPRRYTDLRLTIWKWQWIVGVWERGTFSRWPSWLERTRRDRIARPTLLFAVELHRGDEPF